MAPAARPPPLLRILCLHDAHSHAVELRESLGPLGDRLYLRHGIDLVFVNAPLALPAPAAATGDGGDGSLDEGGAAVAVEDEPSKRIWWQERGQSSYEPQSLMEEEENEEDDTENQEDDNSAAEFADFHSKSQKPDQQPQQPLPSYEGLDASLQLLQQVWASSPFVGILAVGQGAALAALFCLLPTTYPPPRFCIFIHDDDDAGLLLKEAALLQDAIRCLHIIVRPRREPASVSPVAGDENFATATPMEAGTTRDPSCCLLVKQFGGTVYERVADDNSHPVGSSLAYTAADLNTIGRFLIQQKKALHWRHASPSDDGGSDGAVVALQTALHWAELAAADRIAEHIAAHPPPALMAVIRPAGQVAGWCGDKRRQPHEEGGGAPCPSEFLLQREKRMGQGVGRQHPNQQHGEAGS